MLLLKEYINMKIRDKLILDKKAFNKLLRLQMWDEKGENLSYTEAKQLISDLLDENINVRLAKDDEDKKWINELANSQEFRESCVCDGWEGYKINYTQEVAGVKRDFIIISLNSERIGLVVTTTVNPVDSSKHDECDCHIFIKEEFRKISRIIYRKIHTFCYANFKHKKVIAKIPEFNRGAVALARLEGFTFNGLLSKPVIKNGISYNVIVMVKEVR